MLRKDLPYIAVPFLVIASFVVGSYLNSKGIVKLFPMESKIVTIKSTDKHISFFLEIYDLIKQNFWNKLSDEQLDNLVKLAIEKLTGTPLPVSPKDKQNLEKTLMEVTKNMSDEQKNEFYPKMADLVLQNLEPFGRSRLYSAKQTQDLSNTVKNIEPGRDRYADLGVTKEATREQIDAAYTTKIQELQKDPPSPEKDIKIAETDKAYAALKDEGAKKLYDEGGVEPTITYKIYGTRVLYLNMTKFSPTSVQDMVRAGDSNAANTNLDTLIIDLRGNIGGLIDGLPYLLGPFIGNDQYAYQFFNQGNKIDFKTKIGFIPSFVKFNKVIVLIDGNSQSSAEVFASTLKKYNVAVLVGQKTKGWGTVEKVTKLNNQIKNDETYSVMLVHNLTLREDGIPIEGNGVIPDIDITSSTWEKDLLSRYNYPEILDAVKSVLKK